MFVVKRQPETIGILSKYYRFCCRSERILRNKSEALTCGREICRFAGISPAKMRSTCYNNRNLYRSAEREDPTVRLDRLSEMNNTCPIAKRHTSLAEPYRVITPE